MKHIKITHCPFCGSKNLSLGYQTKASAVFSDIRGGVFGEQIEHTICLDCGSIVYSRVLSTEHLKPLPTDE